MAGVGADGDLSARPPFHGSDEMLARACGRSTPREPSYWTQPAGPCREHRSASHCVASPDGEDTGEGLLPVPPEHYEQSAEIEACGDTILIGSGDVREVEVREAVQPDGWLVLQHQGEATPDLTRLSDGACPRTGPAGCENSPNFLAQVRRNSTPNHPFRRQVLPRLSCGPRGTRWPGSTQN